MGVRPSILGGILGGVKPRQWVVPGQDRRTVTPKYPDVVTIQQGKHNGPAREASGCGGPALNGGIWGHVNPDVNLNGGVTRDAKSRVAGHQNVVEQVADTWQGSVPTVSDHIKGEVVPDSMVRAGAVAVGLEDRLIRGVVEHGAPVVALSSKTFVVVQISDGSPVYLHGNQ